MQIINQYSMLWGGIVILSLAALVFLRKGIKPRDGIKLFALFLALFVVWLVIRPERASTNEMAEFQSKIGQGQAVLLEMQSPY